MWEVEESLIQLILSSPAVCAMTDLYCSFTKLTLSFSFYPLPKQATRDEDKSDADSQKMDTCSTLPSLQPADTGLPTGNGKKISNSQAQLGQATGLAVA